MTDAAEQARFSQHATSIDQAVQILIVNGEKIGLDPEAIMAGLTAALVRQCVATMSPPLTPRHVMSLLAPAIQFSAEEFCLAVREPPTTKLDA